MHLVGFIRRISDISINYELQENLKTFYSSLVQILIYYRPLTKSQMRRISPQNHPKWQTLSHTSRQHLKLEYLQRKHTCQNLFYVSVNSSNKYNFSNSNDSGEKKKLRKV